MFHTPAHKQTSASAKPCQFEVLDKQKDRPLEHLSDDHLIRISRTTENLVGRELLRAERAYRGI